MTYTIKVKHLKDFHFQANGKSFRLIPQAYHYKLLPNRLYYIMHDSKGVIIDFVKVNV